jgi:SAM-dependent methyltransferase
VSEPADLAVTVSGLLAAADAAAALGAVLAAREEGREIPPEVAARLDAVIAVLGVDVDAIPPERAASLTGAIRAGLVQALGLATDPGRPPAWQTDAVDPALLRAQGRASANFAALIDTVVAPRLPGLDHDLRNRGAAFLDIGVGVAALAIAMARTFPDLRIVGIDVWEAVLALAAEDIRAAGLTDRIEVRHQDVADLGDDQTYDLVWLASPFIPPAVLHTALPRVLRALRPDGWLLFAAFAGSDPLSDALADLRVVRAGGAVWRPDDAAALLEQAGFVDVQHVRLDVGIRSRLTAARRPPPE